MFWVLCTWSLHAPTPSCIYADLYMCTCHPVLSLSPEVDLNLFTQPKVVFDSMTPLNLHQPQVITGKESTQECVAYRIFHLGFQSQKQDPSGSRKLDRCEMIVSLDDVYLINYLQMKGYPTISDEKQKCKSFSYTVEVSRDKFNWLKLFDYSSFACRSTQNLTFPKQAVK